MSNDKQAKSQEISPSLPHTTRGQDGTRRGQIQQREGCQLLQSQCTPEHVERVIVLLKDTLLKSQMINISQVYSAKQFIPGRCLTSPPH